MNLTRIAYNILPPNSDGETEIEIYDEIANKKSVDWWTGEEGSEVTPADFKEKLNAIETENVVIRMNSVGGSVVAANTISVAIQEFAQKGRKVKCKIDGICASAAVQIALSCSEVVIHQSALMMIHNPMAFLYGYADTGELNKTLNMLTATKEAILDLYEKKTGQGRQKLSNMMDKETWFSGKEAVENGFADSIMFDDSDAVVNRIQYACFNTAAGIKIPERYNIPEMIGNPTNKEVEPKMEIKTVEELVGAYPDLVNAIKTEAVNSAIADAINQGIEQERARIQAIDELADKVDRSLLNKAKYETFDKAENVAMEAIKTGAFVNAHAIANMVNETEPANNVAGLTNGGNVSDPVDEKKLAKNNAANVAANYFKKIGKGE